MTERFVWLDRAVPEAAITAILEEAGWIREGDRPRTLFQARQLIYRHPGSAARVDVCAFVHEGCQTVSIAGDPDAITEAVWPRIEALPRYERHVEDAAALDDPPRLVRGLRQWTVDAMLSGARPPGLDAALRRARDHADEIVRIVARDLEATLTSSSG
jgi:hypothetical protein